VLIALLVAGLLAGCSSVERLSSVSAFDDETGESLTHPPRPVMLQTERPGLSAVGKDYLALSPVTVSGRGATATWLWCALSSSIDRGITGAAVPEVRSIILIVDDVPMKLDIEPWSNAARQAPLRQPIEAHTSFAARITASQLARIATSEKLSAYVADGTAEAPAYRLSRDYRSEWGFEGVAAEARTAAITP
jgi:hypothetical protein